MAGTSNDPALIQENQRLREENARLQHLVAHIEGQLTEPEEIVRAIRDGEIEALVVSHEGADEIYAVQRYESVYRQLVEEALPYGVWLAEPDGRLIYVSSQFLQWIQADLRELQEKGQFHFLPEDFRRRFEAGWEECRISGKPCTFEYAVAGPDGSERVILTHGILTQQGGKPCWAGINLDVTEQRQVQEELQRKAEVLEEADRRKDEFLALLAHELRNPMAPLRAGVDLLQLKGEEAETRQHVLKMMARQMRHLVRLVDDLLDVSRINHGKLDLHRDVLDARAIVADAIASVSDGERHRVTVEMAAAPVTVEGDYVRLFQAVDNLLSNALKFTPASGQVSVVVDREGDRARISVRDQGIGIASEDLAGIFEMFRQADGERSGLGVGLTIARSLVELQGGAIRVFSEGRGRGSEFLLTLPLRSPEPSTEQARPDWVSSFARRILVVDDNRDAAESLAMLLEALGAVVRIAYSGESALAMVEEYEPDVILLDIGMPDLDGYEVARRIRELKSGKPVKLIAVTGWGQQKDRAKAEAAGFDGHLIKPVGLADLKRAL